MNNREIEIARAAFEAGRLTHIQTSNPYNVDIKYTRQYASFEDYAKTLQDKDPAQLPDALEEHIAKNYNHFQPEDSDQQRQLVRLLLEEVDRRIDAAVSCYIDSATAAEAEALNVGEKVRGLEQRILKRVAEAAKLTEPTTFAAEINLNRFADKLKAMTEPDTYDEQKRKEAQHDAADLLKKKEGWE